MSKELREVFAEKGKDIPALNPFVEMPRMRVDAVNYLNELLERDKAMAIVKVHYDITDHDSYRCPLCNGIVDEDRDNFCRTCGQRIDRENIAFGGTK